MVQRNPHLLSLHGKVQEELGQPARVVADHAVFEEQVGADRLYTQRAEGVKIHHHRLGAVCRVAAHQARGERPSVEDDVIEEVATSVLVDGAQMLGGRVSAGFARLGHQVTHEHLQRLRARDGLRDSMHQEVGNQ